MSSDYQKNIGANHNGRVATKLFFAITHDSWGLTQHEMMTLAGVPTSRILDNWRLAIEAGQPIDLEADTLERLSLIAGIRKGIEILYPRAELNTWIRKPNRAFGGQSPLERMLTGRLNDLWAVRRYLDNSLSVPFG